MKSMNNSVLQMLRLRSGLLRLVGGFAMMMSFGACHTDMYEQPRYEPLEPSKFFRNGMSAQTLTPGTIPRGSLEDEGVVTTGKENGELARNFPFPVTPAVLARGEERYNIYCTPCHGVLGDGNGTVVERGFKRPPSFNSAAFKTKPPGHIVDVIQNGFGVMYDYSTRVAPKDRWAIAAYIRALQLSQSAQLSELPEKDRQMLQRTKP